MDSTASVRMVERGGEATGEGGSRSRGCGAAVVVPHAGSQALPTAASGGQKERRGLLAGR